MLACENKPEYVRALRESPTWYRFGDDTIGYWKNAGYRYDFYEKPSKFREMMMQNKIAAYLSDRRQGCGNLMDYLPLLTFKNEKENGDVNPNVDEKTEVIKNANIGLENNSISTNTIFSSRNSRLGLEKTGDGEEPEKRRPRQEGASSRSNGNPARAYPFNYKCGNYVNLEDVVPGEPDWINCDPNDLPPIIDEGWTPPPPERQHNEVVLPKQKNGDDSGNDSIKARELERLISEAIGVIIDYEDGKKPMNLLASSSEIATNAIMELTGCRKAKAVDLIQELKASFRSEQTMKPLKK